MCNKHGQIYFKSLHAPYTRVCLRVDFAGNPQRYTSAQGEELEGVDWK
jgi:hypothetical protein